MSFILSTTGRPPTAKPPRDRKFPNATTGGGGYNAKMAVQSSSQPRLQFSLQGLLLATAMVAIALGFYRLVGGKALADYCFLLFAVGPWFAHLAAECLPVRAPQLRTAAANMILLALFVATLKVAEMRLGGPVAVVVAIAALVLWTPQYVIFFVWRMAD
jgi:hypothetical protein